MSNELKNMVAGNAENAEINCIALGEDTIEEVAEVKPVKKPLNTNEKIAELEQRIFHITNSLDSLFTIVKKIRDKSNKEEDYEINKTIEKKKQENKVEIPEGTTMHGMTKGLSYFCVAKSDGFYVGETKYDSLSAAAEGISGVRRSGWTFWKLPDNRTVKEVYKDVQTPNE